ncbi:MAG: hypothetical protein AAF492_12165 [Verrucomicrobiota bacterium]
MKKLHDAFRPSGVLFSSNPRGHREGRNGERNGNNMEFEATSSSLEQAGFDIVHHYYRPENQPREPQP